MDYELIYSLLNLSVVPAWAMLIFLPRWSGTKATVHSGLYPLALGVFYIICFSAVFFFGQRTEGGGFSTAAGVSTLFSQPLGVLIGWSHYLVFDLFVGAWEARDAQRRGLPHLLLVPCLLLTFILGPIGLLTYVIVRFLTRKGGWSLFETPSR